MGRFYIELIQNFMISAKFLKIFWSKHVEFSWLMQWSFFIFAPS